jgi:hypothetical protein
MTGMGHNGKPVRIKLLLSVGITEEMKTAIEIAAEFSGISPSQLGRQAILEKLVREGYMRHPGMIYQQAQAAQAAKNLNGE